MRSGTITVIHDWAVEFLKSLPSDEIFNRFDHNVVLTTEDGCSHHWRCAFVVKYRGNDPRDRWFVIFPEHADIVVVHDSDVVYIAETAPVDIEIVGGPVA